MSNYKNFIHDFPKRCKDILFAENESNQATNDSYAVTRLILLGATAFVIPFERLKGGTDYFPSAVTDSKVYTDATECFNREYEKRFRDSTLFVDKSDFWCVFDSEQTHPEQVNIDKNNQSSPRIKAKRILQIIRCGLAHGNIFIKSGGRGKIERIIFVQSKYKREPQKYDFLSISPKSLKEFLNEWIKFLKKLKLPEGIQISETDKYQEESAE